MEWTETAGELGALLLEAREVRESQPVYNRQLRGGGDRFTWLFGDAARRRGSSSSTRDILRSGNAFGTWRAARDAQTALEASRAKTSGASSCWVSRAVRAPASVCRWADAMAPASGKEPAAVHLTRVKLGLMPQRLKPWPHRGPMMVREGAGEREQYHVIDGWQHLRTLRCRR